MTHLSSHSRPVTQNPAPSVLLFALSGLGDTLFFLPALAAWKRRTPGLRVTAVTMFDACRELLAACPLVDEVIDRDFVGQSRVASAAFFLGLRRRRFDYGVIPYGSNRVEYNAANFLAGARRRLAHRYFLDGWRNLSFLNQVRAPQRAGEHAVAANAALLAAAGVIPAGPPPAPSPSFLVIPEAARARAAALLEGEPEGGWIGVHAGSNVLKNQSRRCYPPPLFARALTAIAASRPGLRFLILEGGHDRARTDALVAGLPPALYRRVRPAGLLECAALIERCRRFVGNDAGLLHLAAFLGKPCVAIFGPTNPAYVHPWGVPHRVVARGLPCQPCFEYSHRPLTCPAGIDFACVGGLEPERVAAAFAELEAVSAF